MVPDVKDPSLLPSGSLLHSELEIGPFIVDLPIKNGPIVHSYVSHCQRVNDPFTSKKRRKWGWVISWMRHVTEVTKVQSPLLFTSRLGLVTDLHPPKSLVFLGSFHRY